MKKLLENFFNSFNRHNLMLDKFTQNGTEYALFAGSKGSYYVSKWRDIILRLNQNATLNWKNFLFFPSFNLMALIFGSFWFLYRKMYAIGFTIFLGVPLIFDCISSIIMYTSGNRYDGSPILPFMRLLVQIAIACYANTIYLLHADQKIERVKLNQNLLTERLMNGGGTSFIFLIYCLALQIIIMMLNGTSGIVVNSYHYYSQANENDIKNNLNRMFRSYGFDSPAWQFRTDNEDQEGNNQKQTDGTEETEHEVIIQRPQEINDDKIENQNRTRSWQTKRHTRNSRNLQSKGSNVNYLIYKETPA